MSRGVADLRRRRVSPEVMDDPDLAPRDLLPALAGLRTLNRVSSPHRFVWDRILAASPRDGRAVRILDVATGSGDFPRSIARFAAREGIDVHITAVDRNPRVLEEARRLTDPRAPIEYVVADALGDSFDPSGYDALTVNLFLHHLKDDEIVGFLDRLRRARAPLVVVSELRRGVLPYLVTRVASRLLTRSWVVAVDAELSVRAGFRPDELRAFALEAGVVRPRVHSRFPFRLVLELEDQDGSDDRSR